MTLAEIKRAMESKLRVRKIEAQEKATFDYILADLIGISMSRCLDASKIQYPTIEEVYPNLFEEKIIQKQEEKVKKQDELSALRFKLFAKSYNENYKEVAEVNE